MLVSISDKWTSANALCLCMSFCLALPAKKKEKMQGGNKYDFSKVLPLCLLLLHFFTSFTFYYLTDFKSKTQSFTVSGLFSFDSLTI